MDQNFIAFEGMQEQNNHAPAKHHHLLHITHPMIAESPSPDTKIRGDYSFAHDSEYDEHTLRVEYEYMFQRWASIEIDAPYTVIDPDDGSSPSDFGSVEIGLKLAWFGLEEHGIVLGGGIELGLPTGDDNKGIGSNNELEIEPFLDAGYKDGPFEAVVFLSFGIPTNEHDDEEDEVDLELGYNLALMYHLTNQLTVLLELDGESVASGDEDESVLNLGPGIIVQPDIEKPLKIGIAVGWPVTDDKEFDVRTSFSLFWHF